MKSDNRKMRSPLKEIRERLQLQVNDLAVATDTHPAPIHRAEAGSQPIPRQVMNYLEEIGEDPSALREAQAQLIATKRDELRLLVQQRQREAEAKKEASG